MKIVCSIGPNIKGIRELEAFISAGMDYMRLNFSHADYEKYEKLISQVKKRHNNIRIIQDLQGNKLRVSPLFRKEIKVTEGDKINFCSEEFFIALNNNTLNNDNKIITIPISMDEKFDALKGADRILLKDGTMVFKILSKNLKDIIESEVVIGGIIRGNKGLNAPGMDRSSMNLTEKDKKDIEFGLKNDVDVICLSYVTSAKDILELKEYILRSKSLKSNKLPEIWAKIECREGINNFSKILKEVDGIMIGRGDLLSEINIYEIPQIQEKIINLCKRAEKEVIVATYILNSMKYSSNPQLAEVEALYSHIKNNVDGVMLAGEVGVGRYPLDAIGFLKDFITNTTF